MNVDDIAARFELSLLRLDRSGAQAALLDAGARESPFGSVETWSFRRWSVSARPGRRAACLCPRSTCAGRICEELMDSLLPPQEEARKTQPVMAIAVLQDRHLLGKRIVYSVLRSAGYALRDYGPVSAEELVARVARDSVEVVLVSTLMLASALKSQGRASRFGPVGPGGPYRCRRCAVPLRSSALAGSGRLRHGAKCLGRARHPGEDHEGASMSPPAMTSLQRVLTTLGHKEPDRVPFFLLVTMHGARELGLSIREYFSRPDYVAEGQLRMRARYRHDGLYTFYYAPIEIEAWGGEVISCEDGPANSGEPFIRRPEDILSLQPPVIGQCPCLQRVLETTRILKAKTGDEAPIVGVVMSPFSVPVMQMGFDRYLDIMHERQDLFERLMRVNEEFCVAWANAQLEAGATAICYFDPVSSTTIIPPEMYTRTGFAGGPTHAGPDQGACGHAFRVRTVSAHRRRRGTNRHADDRRERRGGSGDVEIGLPGQTHASGEPQRDRNAPLDIPAGRSRRQEGHRPGRARRGVRPFRQPRGNTLAGPGRGPDGCIRCRTPVGKLPAGLGHGESAHGG